MRRRSLGHWAGCVLLVLSCALVTACSDGGSESELPDDVSVPIGKAGGVVRAKGVTLEIPEGALDKTLEISVKNLGKSGPVHVQAVSDVYEFGPKGTKFMADVQVSFDTEREEPKAGVFFTKEGSDTEFEKVSESSSKGKQVSAKVKHFSRGFAGLLEASSELDASSGLPEGGTQSDAGTETLDGGNAQVDASGDVEPDAGPVPTGITVRSLGKQGTLVNQSWAAYQDGDGNWVPLAPTSTGIYQFTVSSGRYGVAFVCANAAESQGRLFYGTSRQNDFDLPAGEFCNPSTPPPLYFMSGALDFEPAGTQLHYYYPGARVIEPLLSTRHPYTFDEIPGGLPLDILLAVTDANGNYLRADVLRDLVFENDRTDENIDMTSQPAPGLASVTILNASPQSSVEVEYTTREDKSGMPILRGPVTTDGSSRVASFMTLPAGLRAASDRYRIHVMDSRAGSALSLESFAANVPADFGLAMPPEFTPAIELMSATYPVPHMSFDSYPDATEYAFDWECYPGSEMHFFSTTVHAAWLEASANRHELTFPDFSGIDGFDLAWAVSGTTVTVRGVAVNNKSDANGSLQTRAETMVSLPLIF